MEKRWDRKGQERTMLVTLMVLIVSFIIILLFIFRADLWGITDREICHNSVVLRDKTEGISGPLDCKTNYLCISGGGDCEITASEKVEVNLEIKEEIMKAIAEEMSSCWWMFGEGEAKYAEGALFSKRACVICSITSFDERVQESSLILSYQDLYNYLRTTPKSSSQSYLNYIYSVNSLDTFQNFYISNYLSNNIDTSKEYFILTGRSKTTFGGASGSESIPITILEKTTENYNAVNCDEFITKA